MRADPHARRLSWTEVAPPVALLALVADVGPAPGGGRARPRRACCSPPPSLAAVHHAEVVAAPGRRAVRLARPRGGRHGHRGGADPHPDAQRRQGHLGARPRHGLRGGDDHLQRHRRALPARGRREVRHHPLQRRGHRRRPGDRDHPGHDLPGAARTSPPPTPGPEFTGSPAGLRGRGLAAALRHVRGHPDGAAPRLLPAGHLRRATCSRRTSTPSARPTAGR